MADDVEQARAHLRRCFRIYGWVERKSRVTRRNRELTLAHREKWDAIAQCLFLKAFPVLHNRLIAAAEARGHVAELRSCASCHDWFSIAAKFEAERDAALLLAGEALNTLNELAKGVFSGMWVVGSGELDMSIGKYVEYLFARPDAQAALAKWREQQ